MTLTSPRRHALHDGFTLVEMLSVVVLLGLVVGGLMAVVVRQQRFYAGASELIELRDNVRQLVDILPTELGGLNAAGKDIYAMSPTAIEFRSLVGASVVCSVAADRGTLTVPPADLTADNGLTSWSSTPQPGDSLQVYDDAANTWRLAELAAAPTNGSSCGGLVADATEALAGWTLKLSAPTDVRPSPGAAIRLFRRARYELYRASDGKWYLGHYECLARRSPQCSGIQPVSGPYLPAGLHRSSGLTLRYVDRSGAETGDPLRVARIDIVARAQTNQAIRIDGLASGTYRDSLSVSVALRNP